MGWHSLEYPLSLCFTSFTIPWCHCQELDRYIFECMDDSYYVLYDCVRHIWRLLPGQWGLYGSNIEGRKIGKSSRTCDCYYLHERSCAVISVFLRDSDSLSFSWKRESAGWNDVFFLCQAGILSTVVCGGYESGYGASESEVF